MSSVELHDHSGEVLSAMDQAMKNALTAIGMTAEGYAKKNTPVDTGRLRNSMAHAVKGDTVYIGTNVEYGPYVELGSRTNKANHMLQKAAQDHTDEYKEIVRKAMGDA